MITMLIPAEVNTVWNYLITAGYGLAAFMILYMAIDWKKRGVWRAKNVALGIALLMFGTSKMALLLTGGAYNWPFMLGHSAFIVFAGLKFYLWKKGKSDD